VPVSGLSDPATTEYLVQAPAFSYTMAQQGNVLAENRSGLWPALDVL